jgi:hypothetical protein
MINIGGWDYVFLLKERDVVSNLQWIIGNLEFWNGRVFQFPSLVHYFWTDASSIGWGAYNKERNLKLQGSWSIEERNLHINIKEVKAIWLALSNWGQSLQGQNLIIFTDSMVALGVIKRGRAKSPLLNKLAQDIWRIIFRLARLANILHTRLGLVVQQKHLSLGFLWPLFLLSGSGIRTQWISIFDQNFLVKGMFQLSLAFS